MTEGTLRRRTPSDDRSARHRLLLLALLCLSGVACNIDGQPCGLLNLSACGNAGAGAVQSAPRREPHSGSATSSTDRTRCPSPVSYMTIFWGALRLFLLRDIGDGRAEPKQRRRGSIALMRDRLTYLDILHHAVQPVRRRARGDAPERRGALRRLLHVLPGLTCQGAAASTMGTCVGTVQCQQVANWQPLTTTMLRQIAVQNKVDGCASRLSPSRVPSAWPSRRGC